MNLRILEIITLLTLSGIDLIATYFYVKKYKKWQPKKPYKLMEGNSFLVFLWNKFGLESGMIIGSILILIMIYLIGRFTHPVVIMLLFLILVYALFNHNKNIKALNKLIIKYPEGKKWD